MHKHARFAGQAWIDMQTNTQHIPMQRMMIPKTWEKSSQAIKGELPNGLGVYPITAETAVETRLRLQGSK